MYNRIPISKAKQYREELKATHIIIFTVSADGTQHVATHGQTKRNAKEAAIAGNKLKAALGWPESLCHASPIARIHENCAFYEKDYGTYCFNGWSGDGSSGWCHLEPQKTKQIGKETACQHFEPKE